MIILNEKEIKIFNLYTNHTKMDNDEYRFRLMSKEGYGYILTITGTKGAWQNSHYHNSLNESYIIQKGWLAYAELINGKLNIKIYNEDDILTVRPNICHNIYLPAKTILHTVKHGATNDKDWISSPELDNLTKKLSEIDILKLNKKL